MSNSNSSNQRSHKKKKPTNTNTNASTANETNQFSTEHEVTQSSIEESQELVEKTTDMVNPLSEEPQQLSSSDVTTKSINNEKDQKVNDKMEKTVTTTRKTENIMPDNTAQQTSLPPVETPHRPSSLGTALGGISLILVLALAGWLYHNGQMIKNDAPDTTLASETTEKLASFSDQLNTLQKDYQQLQQSYQSLQPISGKINSVSTLQQQLAEKYQTIPEQLEKLQTQLTDVQTQLQKLTAKNDADPNLWQLAEANFMIEQAVRKLNNDHDIASAQILLTSADKNLFSLNDVSLNPVRKAIAYDLTTLAAVTRVDTDGIIIQLQQLADNIDTLVLPQQTELAQQSASQQEDLTLSDSISDWKQNLRKSWKGFMDGFIVVKDLNNEADPNKPELSSNQYAYLRENIRLQLLIATQAVPRQQQAIYEHALGQALEWTKSYYDTNQTEVKAFISTLEKFKSLSIQENIPSELTSQPLLRNIVQTRLKNLTNNVSPISNQGE